MFFNKMSRVPRTLQRVVYRHRRSISLLYAEQVHQFYKASHGGQPATVSLTAPSPNPHFLNNANNTNHGNQAKVAKNANRQMAAMACNQAKIKINVTSNHRIIDDRELAGIPVNNCIQFQTINHPKIDVNVFAANLQQFWNFVPSVKHAVTQDDIETIEFKHVSGCTEYPTIVVSQFRLEKLSKDSQSIIEQMINTIPQRIELDPLKNQDFLASGRMWEALTIDEFDSIYKDSPFAASVTAFGIFPKSHSNDHVASALSETQFVSSMKTITLKDGIKVVPTKYDTFANGFDVPLGASTKSANKMFRMLAATPH